MTKTDRRVQRTRGLLQNALIELIGERSYDALTIQDIVERANVGRTTFYLHYGSKGDLYMICHEAIVRNFHFGPLYPHPLSREEFLSPEALPGTIARYHDTGISKKHGGVCTLYFRARTGCYTATNT